jgi:lactoylglutathione lyase
MPNIPRNLYDSVIAQHQGIIHLAFGVDTRKEEEEKALELQLNGFKILNISRQTGDGYYEI